jgi:hypothetical protein
MNQQMFSYRASLSRILRVKDQGTDFEGGEKLGSCYEKTNEYLYWHVEKVSVRCSSNCSSNSQYRLPRPPRVASRQRNGTMVQGQGLRAPSTAQGSSGADDCLEKGAIFRSGHHGNRRGNQQPHISRASQCRLVCRI